MRQTQAIAFVAEAPGEKGSRLAGAKVLDSRTRSGRKLAELLGVDEVADRWPCLNLVDRWPGRTAHGSAFPAGLAKANAALIFETLPPDVDLVLVGQRVARAFGVADGYFQWTRVFPLSSNRPTRRAVVVPHPSGVNRWWNEPAQRDEGAPVPAVSGARRLTRAPTRGRVSAVRTTRQGDRTVHVGAGGRREHSLRKPCAQRCRPEEPLRTSTCSRARRTDQRRRATAGTT